MPPTRDARGPAGAQQTGPPGVELGHRSVARQPHSLQVISQVEMWVGRPCRRNHRQRGFHHAFAQPRDPLGESIVGGHQPIPVRLLVEQLDHHPGRAGSVVAIGAPHQCFPGAEVLPSAPRGERVVVRVRHRGQPLSADNVAPSTAGVIPRISSATRAGSSDIGTCPTPLRWINSAPGNRSSIGEPKCLKGNTRSRSPQTNRTG